MSTPNDEGTTPPPDAGGSNENPLLKSLFAAASEPKQEERQKPSSTAGASLHEVLANIDAQAEAGGEKPDGAKDGEKPEAKEGEKPSETPPPPPAAPAKRVKVRRAKEPEAPPPPPVVAPAAPAAEPPKKEEPKDPDDGLLDEEKEMLRLARFAEKKNSTKYAGHADKLSAFFRKNAEFVAKKQAEDPEYDFSEDNPEYKAFLNANRPPAIPAHEQRALEREMIKEEVLEETRAESQKRTEEEQTRARHDELRKQHKQDANKFWKETVTVALPDELMATIKEHGVAKAREMHPLEYQIADHVTKNAADAVEEFMLISSGVKQLDPNNPQHVGIVQFINDECADFAKNGGDDRVRNGKQFIGRVEYQRLTAQQRAGFWTFSNAELVERAKFATKLSIEQLIKQEYESRAAQGWTRTPPAKPQQTPPKPAPEPTPAATTRPAPSNGAAPPAGKPKIGAGNPVMGALGLS